MSTSENKQVEALWTVADVATRLSWHPKSVYRAVYQRRLPFVRAGGSLRFKPAEIERWITEQPSAEEGRAA